LIYYFYGYNLWLQFCLVAGEGVGEGEGEAMMWKVTETDIDNVVIPAEFYLSYMNGNGTWGHGWERDTYTGFVEKVPSDNLFRVPGDCRHTTSG